MFAWLLRTPHRYFGFLCLLLPTFNELAMFFKLPSEYKYHHCATDLFISPGYF